MALLRRVVVLLHHLALAAAGSFCDNSSSFALEWSDEFEGSELDAAVWDVIEGSSPHPNVDDCYGDQCPPWAGCRAGYCLAKNVYVGNGTVTLRSNNDGYLNYSFTTATIVTRGKKNWSWLDGPYRMCISAQLPGTEGANNNGLWPAHWVRLAAPPLKTPGRVFQGGSLALTLPRLARIANSCCPICRSCAIQTRARSMSWRW